MNAVVFLLHDLYSSMEFLADFFTVPEEMREILPILLFVLLFFGTGKLISFFIRDIAHDVAKIIEERSSGGNNENKFICNRNKERHRTL